MFNKKLNILVLGNNGMLGYEIYSNLKKLSIYQQTNINVVHGFDIDNDVDVASQGDFDSWLGSTIHFDWCINCIAYTNTGKAQTDKEGYDLDYKLNSLAPKYIAEACKKHRTKLIHISTDYVFSERSSHKVPVSDKDYCMFNTDAEPFPCNVYGEHKLLGEEFIKEIFGEDSKDYAILRVSWLYGSHNNKSFVHKFLKNAVRCIRESKNVEMTSNEISVPTSCNYVYTCIMKVINQNLHGTLHAVPGSKGVSRLDFAKAILEYFHGDDVEQITTTSTESIKSFIQLSDVEIHPVERDSYWPKSSAMITSSEFYPTDWRFDLDLFMKTNKDELLKFALED